MSHRIGRIAHIVRDVVSDAISNRLSDPRIHRFTSITRVEVSPDLKMAHVYVSVMGTEAEGATTMRGLESARGAIQTRLARSLDLRQCPMLTFHLDLGLKKAAEIIKQIDAAMAEARPQPGPEDITENVDQQESGDPS
jgi:ribosome-binding factor A